MKKLLRLPAVEDRTGLSDTTIWRYERAGNFPKRRRLGPFMVAWVEDEIDEWVNSRAVGGPSQSINIRATRSRRAPRVQPAST